jgi:RNA polymerase sigma-70 factor (ECF subfamily)
VTDLTAAYLTHAAELRGFLRRRGVAREDVDDSLHDVFVRALCSAYEERGQVRAWLYVIARSVAIDYRRARYRRPAERLPAFYDREAPDVVMSRDLSPLLTCLTDAQRAVIEARYLRDWSLPQTERALGMSRGAVKALQHRAVAKLREVYQ